VTTLVGDAALDETFELSPSDFDDESTVVAYDDVREDTGEYDVSIGLADVEVDGTSKASETVAIGDAGEDMVAVVVGSDEMDEPIAIRVGDSFSDRLRTDQKPSLLVSTENRFFTSRQDVVVGDPSVLDGRNRVTRHMACL